MQHATLRACLKIRAVGSMGRMGRLPPCAPPMGLSRCRAPSTSVRTNLSTCRTTRRQARALFKPGFSPIEDPVVADTTWGPELQNKTSKHTCSLHHWGRSAPTPPRIRGLFILRASLRCARIHSCAQSSLQLALHARCMSGNTPVWGRTQEQQDLPLGTVTGGGPVIAWHSALLTQQHRWHLGVLRTPQRQTWHLTKGCSLTSCDMMTAQVRSDLSKPHPPPVAGGAARSLCHGSEPHSSEGCARLARKPGRQLPPLNARATVAGQTIIVQPMLTQHAQPVGLKQ